MFTELLSLQKKKKTLPRREVQGSCSFQYTASSSEERKTTADPKQEVRIPKPIAQYTKDTTKKEKRLQRYYI